MTIEWKKSICPYCGVGCGLMVGVDNGRVVKIEGTKEIKLPIDQGKDNPDYVRLYKVGLKDIYQTISNANLLLVFVMFVLTFISIIFLAINLKILLISLGFKKESIKVFELMKTLEDNPKKGKLLGSVGGIIIKELKYKSFRFYFIADGFKLKIFSKEELTDLLLKFVRMSDKNSQQKTINDIRKILLKIGPSVFE